MHDTPSSASRPPLLSAGILMTACLAVLTMTLTLLVGVLGIGVGGLALATGSEGALPIGLAMGAGALLLFGLFLYDALLLFACARAWTGSRNWTIVLIVLSAFGLMNVGLFSTPTNVITIVGAALALGQGKCSYAADTV